ncbi:MAG: hypothetical protein Q8L38_08950 [Pseudohongiella sp.]|nr:hypothetical protein [Pseudohongiella sp.]
MLEVNMAGDVRAVDGANQHKDSARNAIKKGPMHEAAALRQMPDKEPALQFDAVGNSLTGVWPQTPDYFFRYSYVML